MSDATPGGRRTGGWRGALLVLILGLFAVSLPLPAAYVLGPWLGPNTPENAVTGYDALVEAWEEMPFTVPWLANPALAAAVVCLTFRLSRAAAVFGLAASLLALTAVFMVHEVLAGYFVWLAAMGAMGMGSSAIALAEGRRRPRTAGRRMAAVSG